MTFTALALSLALQTPINATFDPNEVEYQTVLTSLAQNDTLFLQLQGNIYYRGKTTPVVSSVSWSSGTVSTGSGSSATSKIQLQAEIEESVNGVLVKRIVADGNTVWSYDLSLHEYSASQYGGYGSTRPPNYQSDLLNDLNALAAGPTAYLTKLLRQIYNTSMPYSSWMPGVKSIGEGINPFQDPVTGLSYPTTGNNFYLYDGSPKRSIAFEVAPGNGSTTTDQLANVYFNQIDQLGRTQRLTSWTITPQLAPIFASYLFKPYTGPQTSGWKAVVAPRPSSN